MKKIISLFTIILIILSLSGCSNDGLDKVFKYDISDNPATLDPQQSNEPNSDLIIGNVFCGLFRKNADGSLKNGVCKSYTVSEDGLTYDFKLREDVFWVAGDFEKQCTAADFVYGFRRLFSPETEAPRAGDYFCVKNSKNINNGSLADLSQLGVKAKSDFELEITLDYTNPRFLDMLCDAPAMPCCEEFFVNSRGKYGLSAECTPSNGAFALRSWNFDPYASTDVNNLILVRNYKNADVYNVCPSGLNFFIEDEEDFAADFLNMDVTCVAVSNRYKPLIKGNFSVDEYSSVTCGLIFNRDYEAFRNKDFVSALALLVDREEIVSGISGFEAAGGVVPKQVTMNGHGYRDIVGSADNLGFDREKSLELLRKAKPTMNSKLFTGARIIVPDEISETAVSYIMQKWQREIGFYCVLERLSESEYRRRLESGDYEIALQKLTGKYDSPAAFLEQFSENNSGNYSGYSNFYFEVILEKAQKAADISESTELFSQAEQMLIDDAGFVPIYYENVYFFRQKDAEDVFYNPFTGIVDFSQGKRK